MELRILGTDLPTNKLFSPRQNEIIERILHGEDYAEIGDTLCIHKQGVGNHKSNIMDIAEQNGLEKRTTHGFVSWWYRINFPEVAKRIGVTMVAIMILLSPIDDKQRTRRTFRRYRNEQEFITETMT